MDGMAHQIVSICSDFERFRRASFSIPSGNFSFSFVIRAWSTCLDDNSILLHTFSPYFCATCCDVIFHSIFFHLLHFSYWLHKRLECGASRSFWNSNEKRTMYAVHTCNESCASVSICICVPVCIKNHDCWINYTIFGLTQTFFLFPRMKQSHTGVIE